MRIVPFLLSAAATVGLVVALETRFEVGGSKTPRLGAFLSPQKGCWQNAEPVNAKFDAQLKDAAVQGNVSVYLDERLVPHIYADQEADAYFAQGYVHAKFRLWQMEFQTHAAAGRLSEIMGVPLAGGTNFLEVDKMFRRLGMGHAAENSLKAMEADPNIKMAMDAYTAGVNAYINSLKPEDYPIEYKLLDYKPEAWSNLKSAYFLKYMSFDLAGGEDDFELTNARNTFTKMQFEKLYPYGYDSLQPIVPGEAFMKAAGINIPTIPANADSAYYTYKAPATALGTVGDSLPKPEKNNGSNNWAVHGSKTQSGRPILCSDPHLSLNLPSIWFEIQISTPQFNAYGASFPGSPNVIIGFNDSCAFGFTNGMRDVRDYYEVQFKDASRTQYWYNGAWTNTEFRVETIQVKDSIAVVDSVAYTVWGPVMYEPAFPDMLGTGKAWAVHWQAHASSNELRTFNRLNHAKNYNDYLDAISTYQTPVQNMVFATKANDIAIRQQGLYPAKWYRQGDFLMPGGDTTYAWQGYIDTSMQPVMHNPERGYVSSANQLPYNYKNYPYYMGGIHALERGYIVNEMLTNMHNITALDMQMMQTDNYDLHARWARPILLKYLTVNDLSVDEKQLVQILTDWNLRCDAGEEGASVFASWWDSLSLVLHGDDLAQTNKPIQQVSRTTMLQNLMNDSTNYMFIDDITTANKVETLQEQVTAAFKKSAPVLLEAAKKQTLAWGKFKVNGVRHILRIPSFGRFNLNAPGTWNAINAYKGYHGPSWRMIVHLTDETEAYGIYPAGQSGNPGSKYYDSFVNDWVAGKYYKLKMLTKQEAANLKDLKGTITISKA